MEFGSSVRQSRGGCLHGQVIRPDCSQRRATCLETRFALSYRANILPAERSVIRRREPVPKDAAVVGFTMNEHFDAETVEVILIFWPCSSTFEGSIKN